MNLLLRKLTCGVAPSWRQVVSCPPSPSPPLWGRRTRPLTCPPVSASPPPPAPGPVSLQRPHHWQWDLIIATIWWTYLRPHNHEHAIVRQINLEWSGTIYPSDLHTVTTNHTCLQWSQENKSHTLYGMINHTLSIVTMLLSTTACFYRLLWKAPSHATINTQRLFIHKYPPMCITSYSFIQLSELEQRRLKNLSIVWHGSKGFKPRSF